VAASSINDEIGLHLLQFVGEFSSLSVMSDVYAMRLPLLRMGHCSRRFRLMKAERATPARSDACSSMANYLTESVLKLQQGGHLKLPVYDNLRYLPHECMNYVEANCLFVVPGTSDILTPTTENSKT
jgi:hypothetical protein